MSGHLKGGVPTLATVLVLLLALRGAQAAEEFSFSDNFKQYQDGSDGSPAWSSGGIAWEIRNGALACTDGEKDQALVAAAPIGARVVAQAGLRLPETTSKGWKVAGLCVVKDPANFWHLALVEAPDTDGKRHFVELTEMQQGTWLAQTQGETKLTQKERQGQDFNWEYRHAYRLTVELTAAGITGQVLEDDGTVRAKISYAFGPAQAVACGRPGVTAGGFCAEFRVFSTQVSQLTPEVKQETRLPAYESHGYSAIRAPATGFFHVEKISGTWWTIDPAGNAFFIIGTDHANYGGHWCEKLGYSPYNRNCVRRYGGEEKWADAALERLKAWGFNALGANASPSIRRRGLPHPEFLGLGTGFTGHDCITAKTTWTGFPNVFSPKWQPYCEKQAQRLCAPHKDDPWVLGYFIDNELEWQSWTGSGLFGDTFKKPADHTAKRALVALLKQRHATPAGFNQAWGTNIASFDELPALTAAPEAKTAAAKADEREYTRLVAEKYFSITSAAIRRHDPNHMVLGCRFAGYAPEILDVAGKYCDIFSINCYRTVDLERGVMADNFAEDLRRWHEQSGRPMMITEWSFPALDAGLPCNHGAGQRVPSQADRAFCFTVFQKLLFATPFMVGSNYFMWADEPALGISSTFPEDSNYGLVNENDEPYALLTEAATKLHQYVYDLHSGKVPDVYVKAGKASFTVGNAGTVPAKVKLTLWADGQAQTRDIELAAGAAQDAAAPGDVAAKPGGHFLVCQAESHNPWLETNPAGNAAMQMLYVPGAPRAAKTAEAALCIPIVIANPSAAAQPDATVSLPFLEIFSSSRPWKTEEVTVVDGATGEPAQFQYDDFREGQPYVAAALGTIPPRAAKTLFMCVGGKWAVKTEPAVKYRETGPGFEADNGVLKLVKDNPKSGYAFDRISLRGVELGKFTPLMHQATGQNMWVGPDKVEKVEAFSGPVRLVLELTFARGTGGGETRTQVDAAGKPAPAQTREKHYRTKYRFVIEPGREWFTSQLMWVENTDTQAWDLADYYHYLPSNIGGDAKDDEPRGNYWFDAGTRACFGIVPGERGMEVHFWKDAGGGEHPDAARKLNITLQPGQRYAKDEPVAYVVAAKEEAWKETGRKLAGQRALLWQAFKPDGK